MTGFGRVEKGEFDRDIKINQWGFDFEPFEESFKEHWEKIGKWQQIPLIGSILAKLTTDRYGESYDKEDLTEMSNWEQWSTLHGAQDDVVKGYEDAEEVLQDALDQEAIYEGIVLASNIIAPDAAKLLNIGGKEGEFIRSFSQGPQGDTTGMKRIGGDAGADGVFGTSDDNPGTWVKMSILEALLQNLGIKDYRTGGK